MYADYEFYTGMFGGNEIPKEKYVRMERSASAILDMFTLGKVKKLQSSAPDEIKCCVCELAEHEYSKYLVGGDNITGESVDDYSISIGSSSSGLSDLEISYNIIKKYLINSGLLYRGMK